MNEEQQETTEVRTSNVQDGLTNVQRQTVAKTRSMDTSVVARRVVWYIAGFIITFLAARVVLLMLGANQGNAFVDTVYAIGGFFSMPFQGIFGEPSYGQFYFDASSVVAVVVYAVVAWGISKAFTLTNSQQ